VNVVILSFHVVFVIIRKLWTCGKVIGNHCGLLYFVLMKKGLVEW